MVVPDPEDEVKTFCAKCKKVVHLVINGFGAIATHSKGQQKNFLQLFTRDNGIVMSLRNEFQEK